MLRKLTYVAVPLLAVVTLACKTPTETEQEALETTAAPSPASATALRGVFYTIRGDDTHPDEVREYDWKTSFTVTVQDTSGIDGLKITGIDVRVQPASGGIVFNPKSDTVYFDFNVVAASNQIAKNGSTAITVETWYDLPNAGKEALVTVTVSLVDEDSVPYSDYLEVNAQ